MVRLDVSFFILRPRETRERFLSYCGRGVTVRSKLGERDQALGWKIFSCVERFAPLSIRYLPIFFLVGHSSSAKISLVVPPSVSTRKTVYYDPNSLVDTPFFSPLPFPRWQSLDLFSFSPTTGAPSSATSHRLSTRGFTRRRP